MHERFSGDYRCCQSEMDMSLQVIFFPLNRFKNYVSKENLRSPDMPQAPCGWCGLCGPCGPCGPCGCVDRVDVWTVWISRQINGLRTVCIKKKDLIEKNNFPVAYSQAIQDFQCLSFALSSTFW